MLRGPLLTGLGMIAVVAIALSIGPALAEVDHTVKIGLILPMTGQQASTGKQINAAVQLFVKQHGTQVAGKTVEVILKDDASLPDNTKRLAQELIVNDRVAMIAGFVLLISMNATRRNEALSLVLFYAFTFLMGIGIAPVISQYVRAFGPDIVVNAALTTGLGMFALAAIVYATGLDLRRFQGIFFIALLLVLA